MKLARIFASWLLGVASVSVFSLGIAWNVAKADEHSMLEFGDPCNQWECGAPTGENCWDSLFCDEIGCGCDFVVDLQTDTGVCLCQTTSP